MVGLIALVLSLCGGALWQRESLAAEQRAAQTRKQQSERSRMLAVQLAHEATKREAEEDPLAPPHHDAASALPDEAVAPSLAPDVAAHARGMLSLNVLNAVQTGDAEDAQWIRNQLDDPRLKGAVALGDLETLELAIDCLAHQSDARDEAHDLLEFAAPSLLSDALRWACE